MSDLEKRARMLWVLLGDVRVPKGNELIAEAFQNERRLALEKAAIECEHEAKDNAPPGNARKACFKCAERIRALGEKDVSR